MPQGHSLNKLVKGTLGYRCYIPNIKAQGLVVLDKNIIFRFHYAVLHNVQINFHAVDVNKYRYIQTPIGLLIF